MVYCLFDLYGQIGQQNFSGKLSARGVNKRSASEEEKNMTAEVNLNTAALIQLWGGGERK